MNENGLELTFGGRLAAVGYIAQTSTVRSPVVVNAALMAVGTTVTY
jgi:hypothetical protein